MIDADPHGDQRALLGLAAWCLHLSPMTAPDPPDGLWIDVTGCAHLHGGEQRLLDTLVERLAAAGLCARAGLADTPGTAHAVARYGGGTVVIVLASGQADALALLPLRALRRLLLGSRVVRSGPWRGAEDGWHEGGIGIS